jgi:hypothetical protein
MDGELDLAPKASALHMIWQHSLLLIFLFPHGKLYYDQKRQEATTQSSLNAQDVTALQT